MDAPETALAYFFGASLEFCDESCSTQFLYRARQNYRLEARWRIRNESRIYMKRKHLHGSLAVGTFGTQTDYRRSEVRGQIAEVKTLGSQLCDVTW
jgi:hypothetical protein